MRCDFRSPLTLRIMRLGITLHEAECIATILMTRIVIVVTIMGFTIPLPGNENLPGEGTRTRSDTSGIHPGITGSQCSGCTTIVVDALKGYPAFLTTS